MTTEKLIQEANSVRANAHCPYSNYSVGAALFGENQIVYTGCNFENASYGLSICAERNAIGAMVADGCKKWKSLVIATENGGTPCGACLQVLSEFAATGNEEIILVDAKGSQKILTLNELFPLRFSLGF